MTDNVLGIDIGGTKIRAGLVTPDGEVVGQAQAPTPARNGATHVLNEVIRVATAAAGGFDFTAIGVGAAGVIDPSSGRVTSATGTITGWAGTDIAGPLHEAFGVPVTVRNDAHAHAVAEAARGAGVGHHTVLLVAAGTGVGGAVVVDGAPLLGEHGTAGHLGHVPSPEAEGLRCSCGIDGHLEAISSGSGLMNFYRRLGGTAATSAPAVVELAGTDAVARNAVTASANALGRAIGGFVNMIDPGLVVLAGGLSESGDLWWNTLLHGVQATVLPALAEVPVKAAKLGPDAAVIGAAIIATNEEWTSC